MNVKHLYFFFGFGSLIAAFIFLSIGIYGAVINVQDAGLAGVFCFIAFFIPGIIFTLYWRQSSALEKNLRNLSNLLKGYREIEIAELAEKIGTSSENTELLVAACLGRGYVKGRIDLTGKKFVLETPEKPQDRELVND